MLECRQKGWITTKENACTYLFMNHMQFDTMNVKNHCACSCVSICTLHRKRWTHLINGFNVSKHIKLSMLLKDGTTLS